MSIQKSEIKLDVNGNAVNAHLAAPDSSGPGVLVLHAWWGLNPFFKGLCDRLAEAGFIALAPDLQDGRVAGTIEEAKALMEESDGKMAREAVMAAKEHLRGITKGKIGVIGFSMGAAWAFNLASDVPEEIAAAVLYYGNDDVDVTKIKARVMGHFSDNDEWEPEEWVDKKFGEMKTAGVDATRYTYPGVAHWFMESDRPEYDPAAAQLAWDRTVEFLNMSLRGH